MKGGCKMDLILISEEKLKIILSYQDMLELNIDIESFDYSNVSSKKVFWEILEKAKLSAGFDADKSKLYVQVFPDSDGGCEIFVTKYNSDNPSNKNKNKYTYKSQNKDSINIFVVSNYDNINKLCSRLYTENYNFKTSLYKTEQEKYILTLEFEEALPSFYKNQQFINNHYPQYLSEYGKIVTLTKSLRSQIEEHCTLIIKDNTIEILSSLSD